VNLCALCLIVPSLLLRDLDVNVIGRFERMLGQMIWFDGEMRQGLSGLCESQPAILV